MIELPLAILLWFLVVLTAPFVLMFIFEFLWMIFGGQKK